jgi:glucokinase
VTGVSDAVLGIDIGGSKVALALADRAGRLLACRRRPLAPSGSWERDLEILVGDARAVLAEGRAAGAPARIASVGVSAPGPLDPERGSIGAPPNLPGWRSVPIARFLGERLEAPVVLENDANAAALAEWRFGTGPRVASLVYLTLSTGVGAGVIAGGRLLRGAACSAGELGHAPVEWGGLPCACGLRGCLEAYVGGAAWTRRLRAIAPEGSRALALAGGREAVAPEHVVAAAREGDPFARAELARYVEYTARALVGLCFTLAPERIVLGTIASAAGEELCLAPLRARVRAALWPVLAREVEIVASSLGDELPFRAGVAVALAGLSA